MNYRLLADLMTTIHAAYIACVVFGLVLVLVGKLLGWKWISNRWFRGIHLAMIVLVVVRTLIWTECPLTWWERDLRALADQTGYDASPLGEMLTAIIHPNLPLWIFPIVYAIFGVLVLAVIWLVPVEWRPVPRRSHCPKITGDALPH